MTSDRQTLFTPYDLRGLELPNRFVMSPMTRARAPANGVPDELARLYYEQRASAGLIVSESTCILPGGRGTTGIPCIYAPAHLAGWSRVADSVHAAGGRIFMQLFHCGRVSTAAWQPDGRAPIGPSAIRAVGARSRTPEGIVCEPETPREATLADIERVIDGFARAAVNAINAGMDGVEIHSCNGYLLQQFLADSANQRTDAYGQSPLNRARLSIEVAEAVAGAIGPERTGIRLAPLSTHQAAVISDPEAVMPPLLRALDALELAYVHCVEGEPAGVIVREQGSLDGFDFKAARKLFRGCWIANNFYDPDRAAQAIAREDANLVAFGRPFVANPDFVARVRQAAPMNAIDYETIYVGVGARGYTDYPALED